MRRTVLIITASIFSCKGEAPKKPAGPAIQAINFDQVLGCAPCHGEVVAEWKQSMHAAATRDPIYLGVRALRAKKEKDLEAKCGTCHAPRISDSGVTCATCHAAASVDLERGRGKAALIWGDKETLYGPHDLSGVPTPAHRVAAAPPHMKDGVTLCSACHADLHNANDVPLCQTATEWNQAETTKVCTDCHMPEVDGPSGVVSKRTSHRSHRFIGPRQLWTRTATAVQSLKLVELRGQARGGKLLLEIENITGHAFPSGFPGRLAKVVIKGRDAKGRFRLQEQRWLRKVYVDAKGKPTIAAYGVKISEDSRLEPTEVRKIELPLPANVKTVKVAVQHWLLPPKLAKKISLEDAEVAEKRVVAELALEVDGAAP